MNTFIYYLEKENNPIYIGKSNKPLQRLSTSHYKKFGKDIKQYILDEVKREEWRFWEQYYIELFRSWGFNLLQENKGGGGVCHHNNDAIEKIKLANIGMRKPKSIETRNKMSFIKKGKKRVCNLDFLKTKERGEKISKSKKGISNNRPSIPILQFTLKGEFIKEWFSANEIELYNNFNANNIRSVCNMKQKTAYGYKWKYKR